MMKKLLLLIIIQMIAHSSFAQLIRGPYLQAATSGSIVIRWRTDIAADSRVQYGSSSNALDKSVNDP
jgi:head-tail adaptor